MRKTHMNNEKAVSPVVGVMLMLVVVIIIAAVVSGFAGSLVSGEQKAPQLTADVSIVNTGYYYGSAFTIRVSGVSEPIPSSDVKIVTSWTARNGVRNGTTVLPNVQNTNYGSTRLAAPWATGPGVEKFGMYNKKELGQMFGNYTLASGTLMRAYPSGSWGPGSDPAVYGGYGPGPDPPYEYADPTPDYTYGTDVDGMQAVLGLDWNNLRPGDIVKVKLIHIPTGKAILDQDVAVRGAS
jgi:FlaG/FlaF family flagellin (archaellin)